MAPGEFFQAFKKELSSILQKPLEYKGKSENCLTCFGTINFISKSDKKTARKEN